MNNYELPTKAIQDIQKCKQYADNEQLGDALAEWTEINLKYDVSPESLAEHNLKVFYYFMEAESFFSFELYEDAENWFLEALKSCDSNAYDEEVYRLETRIAVIHQIQNRFMIGQNRLQEVLLKSFAQNNPANISVVRCKLELADIYYSLRDYERSYTLLKKAYDDCVQVISTQGNAIALCGANSSFNISKILDSEESAHFLGADLDNRPSLQLAWLNKAFKLYTSISDNPEAERGSFFSALGSSKGLLKLSSFEQALEWAHKAEKHASDQARKDRIQRCIKSIERLE